MNLKKQIAILLTAAMLIPSTGIAASAAVRSADTAIPEELLNVEDDLTVVNSVGGYDDLWEAAASIGMTPILGYQYQYGTPGNDGEGPENLFGGTSRRVWCTNEIGYAEVGATTFKSYNVNGIIILTGYDKIVII